MSFLEECEAHGLNWDCIKTPATEFTNLAFNGNGERAILCQPFDSGVSLFQSGFADWLDGDSLDHRRYVRWSDVCQKAAEPVLDAGKAFDLLLA